MMTIQEKIGFEHTHLARAATFTARWQVAQSVKSVQGLNVGMEVKISPLRHGPVAHVHIEAALHMRHPRLRATETSHTPHRTTPSTRDHSDHAFDSASLRLLVTTDDRTPDIHNTTQQLPHLHVDPLTPTTKQLTKMSPPSSPSQQNPPTAPAWKMTSLTDETHGPLRIDTDGTLIPEATGDLIHLDTPTPDAQEYYTAVNPHAPSRRFAIPEAKNGATGLDDARARKPIARVVKNWLTGSSRAPVEAPQWVFGTALGRWSPWNAGRKPGRVMFGAMVEARKHEGGRGARGDMVKVLEKWFAGEVGGRFGKGWAERAVEDEKFLVEVEEFVKGLVDDRVKDGEEEEEDGVGEKEVAVPEEAGAGANKKHGWLW
ncbi:hypothetical protein P171DRAFT_473620 [Karstenula rhodostoma CBS 690.94]|uniref:Uncharacterized protein n=1 Tax=Karstenula rhodostoma CBS 690.94 TaxID=1392251 RepID=A0A9P4PH82_9PLEO|nr:hypothetical protein P171DRAFT_473620 [Karstenula rhodostoma CBS 690.94]